MNFMELRALVLGLRFWNLADCTRGLKAIRSTSQGFRVRGA